MRGLRCCILAWTTAIAGGQTESVEARKAAEGLQQDSPGRSIFAAAAQGGFGVETETHSGGQLAPYGENTFVEVPHVPTQLPMTELEAEVQRTSRVAAFLAQDAAVLSKELQGLQISLRGHARLEPDPAEAPAVSALVLGSEEFRAVPEDTKGNSTKAKAADTKAAAGDEGCDGAGQVPCSPLNRLITFDYRYPIAWGLLNWVLVFVLAFLTAWCFCACCCRPRRTG